MRPMPGLVGLIPSGSKVVSSSTSTLEIIHFAVEFNENSMFPKYGRCFEKRLQCFLLSF
jgi:hypothetical protein